MGHEQHPLLARALKSAHDGICTNTGSGTTSLCPKAQIIKPGRDDVAQGGGTDAAALPAALDAVTRALEATTA